MIKIKRCKRCLIPENYPNVILNKNGICNLCLNEKSKDDLTEGTRYKQEFKEYIEKIKGKGEYDCLLLFSGGKDSTYLLYILKEKYGLNVLAVTVDTGLLNPKTKLNIKKIVKHLNVNHIAITPENDFFKRLYRYFIQHPTKDTYCLSVCILCQKLMQSIGLNVAVEKKIPFVALAYSPDQADTYELSTDKMCKSWIPEELYQEPFTEKDRSYFWNPEHVKIKPRVIFPFCAIGYPGVEKIVEKLSYIGLGKKRSFNPISSNCYLGWLLMFLDVKKNNYNQYVMLLSIQIRKGKTKRGKWSIIIPLGNWLLKNGFVKRKEIKYALSYLDLNINKIIAS